MDSKYNHLDHEQIIYELWKTHKVFDAPTAGRVTPRPYTIIMPPPNANDPLHVGHAMFVSVEDIMIRFHRMLGDASLWLPGTDHAGIETQYVFEKKLAKEGKSRFQFDRNTLYKMIWDYVQNNSGVAIDQMKKLGASADWDRYRFTLDPAIVNEVLSTFEKMNVDGLIYRDERLINYCVKCGTAYSELEVVYKELNDPLYYIKYGPFTLATVRPETKFGDTALAVNPGDDRYKEWVGKEIEVEGLIGKFKLSVIADDFVDPEFGTGVVKVTPAHDPNDYAMGQRHHLPMKQVVGFDGKLTEIAGKYAGMKVGPARVEVVKDLESAGLMEKVDKNYVHNVGTCYRCGSVIEPLPLAQFFITVKPLTKKVLAALDAGETKIHGAGHTKILRNWLENLRDWNISRQIVWGIRIPVWYSAEKNPKIVIGFLNKKGEFTKGTLGELLQTFSFEEIETGLQTLSAPKDSQFVVSRTKPGSHFLQETDTFDTWFSSSQWPVVTLKTNKLGDFETYYPTSLMETGYDILPIWVLRMTLMGEYLTGKMPFKDVYLHGLVRDEKGQKMSKSKGNVINPLDLVEKYGADSLRMALVMSTTAGHDSAVGEMKVKGMRNFTNKVWNAARFVVMQLNENSNDKSQMTNQIQNSNDKFLEHLNQVVKDVTQQLNDLKVGLAAETAHNEFWHWYCDEAIEACKRGEISTEVMLEGLLTWLKLLHPFMPFMTEAVWQEVVKDKTVLAIQPWPVEMQ
jgi:valyl-tRNA synthetase